MQSHRSQTTTFVTGAGAVHEPDMLMQSASPWDRITFQNKVTKNSYESMWTIYGISASRVVLFCFLKKIDWGPTLPPNINTLPCYKGESGGQGCSLQGEVHLIIVPHPCGKAQPTSLPVSSFTGVSPGVSKAESLLSNVHLGMDSEAKELLILCWPKKGSCQKHLWRKNSLPTP